MKPTFKSISYKLLSTLLLAAILSMAIYCVFFYSNMRTSALERYISQTERAWQAAAHNIQHAIDTTVDVANKGIYLNRSLRDLLFSRNPTTFSHTESSNSSLMFSYMMNIYSVTPDAVQIRVGAYKSGNSLLLTTENLQRYLRRQEFPEADSPPPAPMFQAYLLPPHLPSSYGHQLSHIPPPDLSASPGLTNPEKSVFTICLPLYHLPNPSQPVGEVSIDISLNLMKKLCGYLYDDMEEFYVIDSDGYVIFSSDSSQIGQIQSEGWPKDMTQKAKLLEDNPFFADRSHPKNLHICRKISSSNLEWYMLQSIPKREIYLETNRQLATLLSAYVLCLMVATAVDALSILRFTRPLKKASEFMKSINVKTVSAPFSDYVSYRHQDEIGVLFHSLEDMMSTINNFIIRQYELDILNRTTELKMLEAQINPHFIYNTLQCLATKSLEHHDKEQYDYISSFGQLLQYSMDVDHTLVPLKEEAAHVNRYISLQKIRFPNHPSVEWKLEPAAASVTVPKMILQPLIENSFKHGCLMRKDRGHLTIGASLNEADLLSVYVSDNGCSPDPDQLEQINDRLLELKRVYVNRLFTPPHFCLLESGLREPQDKESPYAANNIGLSNVLLRLLLNFGKGCDLTLSANEEGGTTVHLTLTYKTLWNAHPCQSFHEEDRT